MIFFPESLILIAAGYSEMELTVLEKCQVVDISSKGKSCQHLEDYPHPHCSATGAVVSGQPLICGGLVNPYAYR